MTFNGGATKCEECASRRDITIQQQREAVALLGRNGVEVSYIGDGMFKAEYAEERMDRQPMIAHLTGRTLVEEAAKLEAANAEKRARKRGAGGRRNA